MDFSPFIFSQILAGLAIGTDTLAMHSKNRKTILLFLVLSCVFLATHFALLKEWIACIIIVGSGLEFLTASFTDSKKFMLFFLGVQIISFYFLYEHWYSWIALVASFLWIVAKFQKQEKLMRLIMMVGTLFWILHNGFAQTPMGVLVEVIFLANNIWGYFRHHKNKNLQ